MEHKHFTTNKTDVNLNIRDYSFNEILELFDIPDCHFSGEDLKRAKKKVLMIHPDKSKLPPEYFLFYKKAFDIVAKFYINNNKINQEVKKTEYGEVAVKAEIYHDKNISKKIAEMDKREFNKTFNTLFEKNMSSHKSTETATEKNKWFSEDTPSVLTSFQGTPNNMGEYLEKIKEENRKKEMVIFKKPQVLYSSFSGHNYYDDDDADVADGDGDGDGNGDGNGGNSGKSHKIYVECDPFSKLKYDDLRKVHKDQTIFNVSEKDYEKTTKYKSVGELSNVRSSQHITPISKEQGETLLSSQEEILKRRMYQRQHLAEMKIQENIEKNKNVLASFLRLT